MLSSPSSPLKISSLKKSCAVVGVRGYTGLELAKLLLRHPHLNLTSCFATSADFKLSELLLDEEANAVACLPESELMQALPDVVFLATPAEVSLKLAPQILQAKKHVIDLSGAFRLKKHDYKTWYHFEHGAPESLDGAHYGLAPWCAPLSPLKPALVANPGCYATAIAMALIPLLKRNLIDPASLVIDAKSGTSGAGKKAAENLLFTEVDGECLPYKVGRHQHLPEILESLEIFSAKKIPMPHMTTHLLPTRRGIIAGLYANTANTTVTLAKIEAAYSEDYSNYSLLKVGALKTHPQLLSLKKVVGTARTHIAFELIDNKLYVFSLIDNLLKGAASQAVENFNRLFDLPVETGLLELRGAL